MKLLLLLSAPLSAQVFCTEFCLFSKPIGDQVQFRLEAPATYQGWFAFGLGSSMARAEVYMGYLSQTGLPTLVRRLSTQHEDPVLLPPDFQIVSNETGVSKTKLFITFTRPKTPAASGVDLSSGSQNIIWAVNSKIKPTLSNAIEFHTSFGFGSKKDLFATQSAFLVNATAPPTVFAPAKDDGSAVLRKQYTLLHGWFMVIGWFVAAPIGIIVARFFKGILGVWWFRIHVSLLTLAFLLTGFGFALIYASVDLTPYTHLDPSNFDTVGGAHVVTGLMIVIMSGLQVISGVLINYLFKPDRVAIPWHDQMHWWFGRLNMLLAWVCVPLGISLYGTLFDASNKDLSLGLLLGWAIAVIGTVGLLQFRLGQTHDLGAEKLAGHDDSVGSGQTL